MTAMKFAGCMMFGAFLADLVFWMLTNEHLLWVLR